MCSRRDAASVIANSEREEQIGITACFGNVSGWNNRFHEVYANDEVREDIPDVAGEVSVP